MTEAILAAGAVVWRPAGGAGREAEVLLVHRPKYDDWSLPKGKREPGEHLVLTAAREVFEETSVRPVLGPRLSTVEYQAPGGRKRVEYWSARSRDGKAAPAHEVDAVSWLPQPEAAKQASYPHDAGLISALRPLDTTPLLLVRHASAGSKDDWDGHDDLRPLDQKGAADASVLARLLACFAPRARVVSSPALRCTQTMKPFAESFGGSVETAPVLAPPSSPTSSDGAIRQLICDLVAGGRPAAVCLHRENLPKALVAACAALGASSAVPLDPSLPKGAFWVVHAAAGELAGLECYEPLALASFASAVAGVPAAAAVAAPRRRRITRRAM
jgi:phosphohistidine phosphatase SixA/ADP-ribose pyrophosphatase YjhB (NUDIX family)